MFSKAFSVAAVALAASSLVSAQTYTDCDPLKKTCPPNPAFGDETVSCDFTKGECGAFHGMHGTDIKYDGKGAHFTMEDDNDAPTIRTDNYMFFGRIDVVVQAAEGRGIVTSAVLQSDDLDEIDWEWVGGDNAQVQTNYFSKGDTSTYDRGAYHPVDSPLTSTHKYSIEWNSKVINWLIDDNVVRTLNAADAKGGEAFPQTPMQVKLGTWVGGGKSASEGTREWAGGASDFSKGQSYTAYYKSITIVDYAGKDSADQNPGAKTYVYGDKSGSWESIIVKKGDGDDEEKKTTKTSKTKSAEATKTKSEESTETKSEEEETTTESKKETKTKDSDKETKTSDSEKETTTTESEKETKTSEVKTTLSTATATATTHSGSDDSATPTKGSGDKAEETGSGSPSETEDGDDEDVPTTVPVSAGSRLLSNVVAAAAGLFIYQLL